MFQRRIARLGCGGTVALAAAAVAIMAVLVWTIRGRSDAKSSLSAADRTACEHASPLRKVKGVASFGPYFIARLTNFDITGVSGPPERVVTFPLYPRYPSALLTGKIGIEAHHRLTAPVILTAFYCSGGGTVGLFSFTGQTDGPTIPRPASSSVIQAAGSRQATLFWPPPISAPPEPLKWLVYPYFYKPGIAVIRFTQRGKVIDYLTFHVCLAGGPNLTCR